MTMTGSNSFRETHFYRICEKDEKCGDGHFQFVTGLNDYKDTRQEDDDPESGFFIFDVKYIFGRLHDGDWLRRVIIPEGEPILPGESHCPGSYRCRRIILLEPVEFWTDETFAMLIADGADINFEEALPLRRAALGPQGGKVIGKLPMLLRHGASWAAGGREFLRDVVRWNHWKEVDSLLAKDSDLPADVRVSLEAARSQCAGSVMIIYPD